MSVIGYHLAFEHWQKGVVLLLSPALIQHHSSFPVELIPIINVPKELDGYLKRSRDLPDITLVVMAAVWSGCSSDAE